MSWENLKIGLRKCPLRTKSRIFFLLFFVVGSLFCYSLSPEEVAALKDLSPEVLISIILIYDEAQNDLDGYLETAEQGSIPLLMELQEVRALLIKQETESALQENLSLMLLSQHKLEVNDAYNRGFKHGAITGTIIGCVFGGFVGFGLGRIE